MSTRTWIVITVVIVGLALFVFGKEAVSYLAGVRHYARNTAKNRIPTEVEIARLKTMLGRLDKTIENRRASLVDMQLQAESLEKEIGERQKALSADRAVLEKAAALLENRQETYAIGGLTYAYAEVDADARIKAERFGHDMETIGMRQDTLVRYAEAINATREMLSNAEVERQRLADDIERLDIRAASLKTTSQIASARQAGADTSLGTAYEDIQRAAAELERRLSKGERLTEFKQTGSAGIHYAKNEKQQSGLEAIWEALQ